MTDQAEGPRPEESPRMKRCPYCAEEIREEAIKCRYCGSDLRHSMSGSQAPGQPAREPSPAPPAEPSPVAEPSPEGPQDRPPDPATPQRQVGEGAIQFSHSGFRYLLGYGIDFFGIWDREVPGGPSQRFPRTDEGWATAWHAFVAMEPNSVAVGLTPGGHAAR